MAKTTSETRSAEAIGDQKLLAHLRSPWKSVPDVSAAEIIQDLIDDYNILKETGWQKPMFIYGAPGIGKTELVAQVCERLGIGFMPVELRYSQPVDLIGVPKVIDTATSKSAHGSGVTRSNPPTFWPRSNWPGGVIPAGKTEEDGPGGAIFFDEFNRADPYVMDSLMQFVQTRTLPGTDYVLPSRWMVVAAGNRPKDDRAEKIRDLGSAMIDRFTLVNYVATPEGLLNHVEKYEKKIMYDKCLNQLVIPEMVTFIKHMPEFFHGAFNEDSDDMGNFTPRGWIDAAKKLEGYLQQRQKDKGKRVITEGELRKIFTKEVGTAAANAFLEYYQLSKEFSFDDIGKVFKDPKNAPTPGKKGTSFVPNRMWAWTAAIINHAEKMPQEITPEEWGNFIKYWIMIDAADYATAAMSMMLTHVPYIRKKKAYYEQLNLWEKHYKKMMQE